MSCLVDVALRTYPGRLPQRPFEPAWIRRLGAPPADRSRHVLWHRPVRLTPAQNAEWGASLVGGRSGSSATCDSTGDREGGLPVARQEAAVVRRSRSRCRLGPLAMVVLVTDALRHDIAPRRPAACEALPRRGMLFCLATRASGLARSVREPGLLVLHLARTDQHRGSDLTRRFRGRSVGIGRRRGKDPAQFGGAQRPGRCTRSHGHSAASQAATASASGTSSSAWLARTQDWTATSASGDSEG